jgi:hypothetical protein
MTTFLELAATVRGRRRAFSKLSAALLIAFGVAPVVACGGDGGGSSCPAGNDCAGGGSAGAGGQTGGGWGTGNFGGSGSTGASSSGGFGAVGGSSGNGGGAPVCGNGSVEPGETCDGNCPTSCPVATDPCEEWKLIGNPLTCNAKCALYGLVGCSANPCPKNVAPSSALGTKLFSGEFMDEQDVLTGSGSCKLFGRDAAYAWQAPSSGTFEFSMCALGAFYYSGSKVEWDKCQGSISVLEGATCAGTPKAIACNSWSPGTGRVSVKLAAGQQVLVVASRSIDTDKSDLIFDVAAPFTVSIEQCVPNCGGKSCGDDGCGGTCGTCTGGDKCSSSGQCVCTPSCSGKTCGDNGCGGSCGTCSSNSTCSASGQCVCTPACSGKTCGDNGCGGSCGTCSLGKSCASGSCVADPNACDPVTNAGCALSEGCWLLSTEKTACSITGSGTQGSGCSSTSSCAGGHGCFAGTCRKLCQMSSGAGCVGSQICNGVAGWKTYGACN